ncbi:MAG: 30S ribosomal protein S2 [Patescibacteria group bacterium]|nr:30S ribosomal protein S2 [Patescibacteria group bacterium]
MAKTTQADPKKPIKESIKADDTLLKQLLEAGAHFGHRQDRWNPKMKPYIYGARGGVHIIDLTKTHDQLLIAEKFIEDTTKIGGTILFVSTKRQARPIIQKAASDTAMPFVINRWLGGMLTNLETIQTRVTKLKKLQEESSEGSLVGTKKERADQEREMEKLSKVFTGISEMQNLPSAVFIVDIMRDDIAVSEANKLGIPIVAICDTNTNPELITYPVAANDDAVKTISLIVSRITAAALRGSELYKAKTAESAQKEAAKNNQEEK